MGGVMVDAIFHDAFYQLVPVSDPIGLAAQLRQVTAHVQGSVIVAHEGINGVLAGTAQALHRVRDWLAADPRFARMPVTRSACSAPPFGCMKVHVKPEVVSVGVQGSRGTSTSSQHLSPQAWRELLAQDDVVLLDNRNHFEFRLGHFRGAIDPLVNHFRDFPDFVQAHAPTWRAQKKKVAMYCTGGIRCEKLGPWMAGEWELEVYQLQGGILNFFQTMLDAHQDWQGLCFVFDRRLALNTKLQETGVSLAQVYQPELDGAWRIERAQRLMPIVPNCFENQPTHGHSENLG